MVKGVHKVNTTMPSGAVSALNLFPRSPTWQPEMWGKLTPRTQTLEMSVSPRRMQALSDTLTIFLVFGKTLALVSGTKTTVT